MATITLRRQKGGTYAQLQYKGIGWPQVRGDRRQHLGPLPRNSPTPILDVVLKAAEHSEDVYFLVGLLTANKAEREPNRRPGAPRTKKRRS